LKNLRILADQSIPLVKEAFGEIGSLRLIDGREITREAVENIDVLIVRHVTRVDEKLVEKTAVKFVGTVTSGKDHIDTHFLKSRNISFASAPGCNAEAVAEYVIAALLSLHSRGKVDLKNASLGIIGVGHVGSKVAKKAEALGMKVFLNDPPKAKRTGKPVFLPLDALMDCDILTIHTPLIFSGKYKTLNLFDSRRFSMLKKGTILINSARGDVVDEAALRDSILSGRLGGAVIDVWRNEPCIDSRLYEMVEIATPHIAGLSREGRSRGVAMVYKAVCRYFGIKGGWSPPPFSAESMECPNEEKTDSFLFVNSIVKKVFDIDGEAAKFKKDFPSKTEKIGKHFWEFRKNFSQRREFSSLRVILPENYANLKILLKNLGFGV